jgi:putative DNA primase/helicase
VSLRVVDQHREHLVVVPMSSVVRRPVPWLWPGRLAKGMMTLLSGDPSAGKTWLALAMATAVAHGAPFPGQSERRKPSRVLLLATEDSLEHTIGPRLDALGADDSRIEVVRGVANDDPEAPAMERELWLNRDMAMLEEILMGRLYSLVIIDPLNNYIPNDVDTNKDNAVRSVLTPLARLADTTGVSLLSLRHLTKGTRDKAIYRGQGSIAFNAVARFELLAGIDPKDATGRRRLLIPIKCNVAPLAAAISYEIGDNRGLVWGQELSASADTLLGSEPVAEERTQLTEATDILREILEDGELPAKEAEATASKAGVSRRTLKRARYQLGVKAQKRGWGRDAVWFWRLPSATQSDLGFENGDSATPKGGQEPQRGPMVHLGGFGPLSSQDGRYGEDAGHTEWRSIFESGPSEDPVED